jgi:hypothetical protein
MRTDKKTQEFIKHWGKPHVPTARVSHGTLAPQDYPGFALLGWVEQRRVGWPVVGLRLTLLNSTRTKAVGGLTMGIPLTPVSERHVCCLLQDLGWDGRVWPYKDHGWPEDSPAAAELLSLLRTVKLGATMTFPEGEDGTPTVCIPVLKRSGAFQVAPFSDTIVPRYLEALRSLAADPTPFKSDWEKKS